MIKENILENVFYNEKKKKKNRMILFYFSLCRIVSIRIVYSDQ